MRARLRVAPRERVDLALDRAAQQPVPARVELDLVDPVAVAVVGEQPRLVALGAAAVLLRLGRAGHDAAVAHAVDGPARALALERLLQRHVGRQQVDVLERDGLVEDLRRWFSSTGGSHGGQDEGCQAGGELVRVGVAAGERPEQRLGERADDRGRGQVGVGVRQLAAAMPSRSARGEEVGVGAPERQPLGLHGRVDRLGDQRVGAHGLGQRAVHERVHPGRQPLAHRHRAVPERHQHVDLALRGAPERLGEQVALGGEVAVDAAGGDAGAARHGGHRGRGVAALGELVERGGDDPLACGGARGRGSGRSVCRPSHKK